MPPDLRRCAGVRDRDSVLGSPTYRERRMPLRAIIIDPRVTALPVASPLSNGPADATGENHQRCPLAARDSSQRAAKRPMLSALAVRPAPTSGLAARRLAHAAVVAGG